MILLIDNYDSFVYNLARYFQRLGQETVVVRNDAVDAASVRFLSPRAIVLSPGPCTPGEAGCSVSIVKELWCEFPILGVCLGHQAIAAALGGKIVRAPPMHGRTSAVLHDGRGVFADVPNPVTVCRYHSLVVDPSSVPGCLDISARTSDGVVMAIRHRAAAVVGLQFHPESILTECGYLFLCNFLRLAGVEPASPPDLGSELEPQTTAERPLPKVPVTF